MTGYFLRHARRRARRFVCSGLAAVGLLGLFAEGRAESPRACERAGAAAEQAFGLPPGLLQAIGRVESGKWDAGERRAVAWPWSVDVDGVGRHYDTLEAALSDVKAQLAGGGHSIDVGCFQINLGWHPDAFASLEAAFDPVANANYAAVFLRSLNQRLGSWPAAVAAYHSANPDLGEPYRERVMAVWSSASVAAPAAVPVWQAEAARFGMHIWTPSNSMAGATAGDVRGAGVDGSLPRIITPGR